MCGFRGLGFRAHLRASSVEGFTRLLVAIEVDGVMRSVGVIQISLGVYGQDLQLVTEFEA